MRSAALIFVVVWLAWQPTIVLSCRCEPRTINATLASQEGVAFRGTVIRKLEQSITDQVQYVVHVGRVFKGCAIRTSDRVVVSTGSNSTQCGVDLVLNANYVLTFLRESEPIDDAVRALIGRHSRISQAFSLSSCDYHQESMIVSAVDKLALRANQNRCQAKCQTGSDCSDAHYCDAGTCVLYNNPCPDGVLPTPCSADPCTSATSSCSNEVYQCIPMTCGACYPIYVAPNGTRVCHK